SGQPGGEQGVSQGAMFGVALADSSAKPNAAMLIPYDQLQAETLTRLIEDFVTRDGTDNGDDTPLETRVLRVRQALAKGAAKGDLVLIQFTLAIGTGMVAGAVGRAATAGFEQCRFAVGQTHHQHAVVHQRQHHRQQGGFLSAVQAGGGGEHRGGLAHQFTAQPQGGA
ncbi:YheU family protein, partial [Salmonella sp. NW1263]|uniref:YheU family protein n=1 Tax=Salmonella sp. NW1263 TaxID=2947700 RepID=UPI003F448F42